MKLKIHKVNIEPVELDDCWVIVATVEDEKGNIYQEEIFNESLEELYEIVVHCNSPTLEPFVIEFEDE